MSRSTVFSAIPLIILLVGVIATDGFAQRRSASSATRSSGISRSAPSGGRSSGGGRSAGISSSRGGFSGSSRSAAVSPSRSFGGRSSISSSSRSAGARPGFSSGRSATGGFSSRSSRPTTFGGSSRIGTSSGGRSGIGNRSSGSSANRVAPYGTNSGPRLYRGDYSRGYAGTSRSNGSVGGSSRRLSSSGSLGTRSTTSGSRSLGARRSASLDRSADGRSGLARPGTSYRSSASYRSSLDGRLGSGGGSRSAIGGARNRDGFGDGPGPAGTRPRADGVGLGSTGRADSRSGSGRGDHGRDRHHHDHYRNRHSDFYFFLGGCGYGFGYYGGSYYWRSAYWDCHWWNWGYPSWYCGPYWYPRYSSCYYPYYWSYRWYPRYRSVYLVDYVREPYVASGYLPAAAFDDDPYAEGDLPPVTASGTSEAIVPIVAGLDAGADCAAATAAGDAYLRAGKPLEAAEAYRQAWIHDPRSDALARMAWALWDGGDYPLAAWALAQHLQGSEKRMLDAAVLLDDLFDGPRIRRDTEALERYLVDNPNDEGSNLLLGSIYVLGGREYAGLIVLGRLQQSGYERATTELLVGQARTRLQN